MKLSLIIFLLSLCVLSLNTLGYSNQFEKQIQEIRHLTEEGYYNFDSKAFQKASALCDRILSVDEGNIYALYYKAYSYYRILNIGMIQNVEEILGIYLKTGIETGETLVEHDKFKSEAYTVLAAIQMMNLSQNPGKAAQLFSETSGYLGKALAADSLNPRTYLIKAILMFNTPAQYGGGPTTSIKLLEKANILFDTHSYEDELMPRWGKYEAMAWTGMAYQKMGQLSKAKEIYEKIINEKPDYGWVKHQLLPSLENSSYENAK